MKLYYVIGSPNCRKVHAVVNHLGIGAQIELQYLDFMAGEARSPEFLQVNPNGMVPVLRDGSFVLWESNAIMQYLADRTPGQTLLPRDAQQRADVVRWQCWELAHYNKAFGVLSFETVAKPGFLGMPPDTAKVEWSKAELARFAAVLDGHLNGREVVVGDTITIADYSLIHLEGFKEMVPFDWSPYGNLNAYYERMRALPHWARTAPPSREAIGRRPQPAPATLAA